MKIPCMSMRTRDTQNKNEEPKKTKEKRKFCSDTL